MALVGLVCRSLLRPTAVGHNVSALSGIAAGRVSSKTAFPALHQPGSVTALSTRLAHYDTLPRDEGIFEIKGFKPETFCLIVGTERVPEGSMSVQDALLTQPREYNLLLVRRNTKHAERLPVLRRFSPECWSGWEHHRKAWKAEAAVRRRQIHKAQAVRLRQIRKEKKLLNKGRKVYEAAKRAAKKRKR
eukprot:scpid94068/ scgid12488/ 